MEREQNNKVVYKESNDKCVAKLEAKLNTKSFSYSTTRWITHLNPSGITSKKPSHIPSSGLSDNPMNSPSVAISVIISPLTCITPTTFPSDVPSKKPIMLVL